MGTASPSRRPGLTPRLSAIFAAIVAAAIGVVYVGITPSLEDRLRDQKLDRLSEEAARYEPALLSVLGTARPRDEVEDRARAAAARSATEVTVLGIVSGTEDQFYTAADSSPGGGVELEDVQSVASDALALGRTSTTTEPTRVGRRAIAARPLAVGGETQFVLVFADELTDVSDTVSLIRRRILVFGAIALLAAVVAGYLVARALAARVKRLERAARKVAAGDFTGPITADADDELGQLAAAFDDMQQQLARLDRARKQFIASASHELRTPIFSVAGFLELLDEDPDLDEATRARFIHQIRGQVGRLQKLAAELLDLSRLESGAVELRFEPTDVGELAREVAGEFAPAVQRHGSSLTVQLPSDPLEIECDPERVAQVLRILLDNALVHTPQGTGITVSASRDDGHVRVDVADRGLGIKRQNMPHIFEPFYTSDPAARGAGLGLAIGRELAGTMRGELAVRSVPGSTTFTLRLPA